MSCWGKDEGLEHSIMVMSLAHPGMEKSPFQGDIAETGMHVTILRPITHFLNLLGVGVPGTSPERQGPEPNSKLELQE